MILGKKKFVYVKNSVITKIAFTFSDDGDNDDDDDWEVMRM